MAVSRTNSAPASGPVTPNKLAKYGFVAEVLAEAQRLGVVKLGIIGNEQYMDQ